MSQAARILSVFGAPGRAFEAIARDPQFLLAWCVQIVVGVVFFQILLHRVGAETLMRQSLMQSARGRAMDPAAMQQAIHTGAKFYAFIGYASPAVSIVFLLFLGWIFQGIANFLLGQEAKYQQALAMVSHAYLTQTLVALLNIAVLVMMADPTAFNLVNPLGTNIGFYLDKANTSTFVYAFSTHLDIFTLWTVLLLSLGLAKMGAKPGQPGKFASALTAVGGLWLLYAVCSSGLTAAFA
jgi:hypothetical protein